MIVLAKDLLKYLLITGIGLFLLLGIIRPAFKNFSAASVPVVSSKTDTAPETVAQERSAAQYAAQQTSNSYENNLEAAKKIAGQDPKIVASVVQGWVNNE